MIKPGTQNTDVRLYFLGQLIKTLKKTGVTSKYLRRKGGMKKIEIRKKRRFNGSADEITKNNYQLGFIKKKRKEETIMATRKLDIRLCSLIGILGLFLFTPIVQAQTPFDVTECGGGPVTIVFQSPEVTVSGLEGKGIFFSNHENKLFNNFTFQVVQIARVIGSNRVSNSYWKIMDPDGDAIVASVDVVGPEKTMAFLHGTGKWKGIKGGAKGKTSAAGKFIVPGTFQACSRYVGTFELAK